MNYPGYVKDVKKIAVLRANALGDFVVTLPALHALRATYPYAEIVLLGKPWHQEFLVRGRTPIDRVIIVPVKKGIRNEEDRAEDTNDVKAFFERMRKEQFDIAISFQGYGISANPFLKQLGAKLTVGSWTKEAERVDRFIQYYYYQPEVLRYLEIVKLIGAVTHETEPRLSVLESDKNEIREIMSYLGGKPYVLINPVANDNRRMWPWENYIRLADSLRQDGIEVLFTGSEADRMIADTIINGMQHQAINACGVSIGGLAALASSASLMVSPDTGPLHVAQAVQCPTVGIYWAPNAINWAPLNRRIHRPVISWKMECPYCGIIPNDPYPFEPSSTTCRHEISFVRDITVDQVYRAAEELLQTSMDKKVRQKEFVYH
ncbi:glycosyltransferase family 9 protein [Chryseosolibacter indicus]|uniref:Glycosyltransferase family 9 protein n=1 Tax=Chryseosolibacter indicus TaxID=2782351 RepID=A0ABS5VPT4_9BACT|nr:glycosyltransferase family 9 protein [Chryseosolibacter indicus]MBT1702860.1 glycosyltransferase family 9 protein [Chryseosolibacter indicus]